MLWDVMKWGLVPLRPTPSRTMVCVPFINLKSQKLSAFIVVRLDHNTAMKRASQHQRVSCKAIWQWVKKFLHAASDIRWHDIIFDLKLSASPPPHAVASNKKVKWKGILFSKESLWAINFFLFLEEKGFKEETLGWKVCLAYPLFKWRNDSINLSNSWGFL